MSHSPEACSWFPFSDEPLVQGVFYAPGFFDPQVLMPENSFDGKWHLFFHSWIGIHHFVSDSGIDWKPRKMIELGGHSPFIYKEGDKCFLLYEKHAPEVLFPGRKKTGKRRDVESRIEVRTSTDLLIWSKPRILLDSSSVPYAGDYLLHPYISRPQLLKTEAGYRLYFGASHLVLPDTAQKVSRYFGYAESQELTGPYTVGSSAPLIEADPDDRWTNLACGSIRIVQSGKNVYAFRCGVYWDNVRKSTHSALTLMKSEDGLKFSQCMKEPVLLPADSGWAGKYIMSCDVHYRETEKTWYCYFSANGTTGRRKVYESIGLLLGKPAVSSPY